MYKFIEMNPDENNGNFYTHIYIYILALIGIENDLWNVRVNTLYAYRMQNGGPMYARLVEDAWRI